MRHKKLRFFILQVVDFVVVLMTQFKAIKDVLSVYELSIYDLSLPVEG